METITPEVRRCPWPSGPGARPLSNPPLSLGTLLPKAGRLCTLPDLSPSRWTAPPWRLRGKRSNGAHASGTPSFLSPVEAFDGTGPVQSRTSTLSAEEGAASSSVRLRVPNSPFTSGVGAGGSMTHHGIWRGLGPFHLFVLSARLVVAPRLLPRKERKVSERQTPPGWLVLRKCWLALKYLQT